MIEQLRVVASDRLMFLSAVSELSDPDNEENVVPTLIQLEAEGLINISAFLSSITRDDRGFWTLVRVFVRALSGTNIAPQQFLQAVQDVVKPLQGDIALIDFTEAISNYCAARDVCGAGFVDACMNLSEGEDRAVLLSTGLIGLGKGNPLIGHAKSLVLSRHADTLAQRAAIFALGVFGYKSHMMLLPETEERFTCLYQEATPAIMTALATAISRLLQSVPSDALKTIFLKLCCDPASDVCATALRELWLSLDKHYAEEWHQQGVSVILDRPMFTPNELDAFDHLIRQMLAAQPERALECLERWALAQPKATDVKLLRSTASQLRSNHHTLCRCITRWFNSNCRTLHALAAFLVQRHSEHTHDKPVAPLLLDEQELTAMTAGDVRFLLGKIVGYCFVFEKALVSLVFSALQKSDFQDDIDHMVTYFFASYIALDYPGSTQDFLKTVEGERHKRVASTIAEAIRKYFDPLTKLPVLKECQMSEINHQKLLSARCARDSLMMKEVEETSILKHIATTFMVKKGRAFFSKFDHEAMTGRKPQFDAPTPFVHHSITTEMPRHSFLDPVGIDWQLRLFRSEIRAGGRQ